MERIIVFGGTFDPPHNGHVTLLENAVRAVKPAKVLVIPTGTPPHKNSAHTPAALRAAMCACFLPVFPGTMLDETEIHRTGKSYTVDTLIALRRRYPHTHFYLPMGSDMLLYFREWYQYEQILKMATLVVHCRQNEDKAPVQAYVKSLRKQGAHVVLTNGEILEESSTEIRQKIAQGKDISALVPPNVLRIIEENNLYR